MTRPKHRLAWTAFTLLCAGLLQPAHAQFIVVDDYATPQALADVDGSNTGPGILGGTRDYTVFTGEFGAAGGQGIFQSETFFLDPEETQTSSEAAAFNFYGSLDGSNDLNLDLSTYVAAGGVYFDVSTLGTPDSFDAFVNIFLTSAAGDQQSFFDATFTTPGGYFVPFSSFFANATNPVDFADVDELAFEFKSNVLPNDTQLTIDTIGLYRVPSDIPEPTSLALLALGALLTTRRHRP